MATLSRVIPYYSVFRDNEVILSVLLKIVD